MFPTSKCTNFPSKKLKWFLGKKKKLRHFAVCTAISCLVSKEDLSLLFLLYDFSGIRTTGDSTSVTFASLTKVATCAKFLPSHPRLYSRFSMSKVSKCNAKQKLVTEFISSSPDICTWQGKKDVQKRRSNRSSLSCSFFLASASGDLSSTFMNLLKKKENKRGNQEEQEKASSTNYSYNTAY